MSHDHFSKNLKIDKLVVGLRNKSSSIIFSFILINFYRFTFGMTVHCTSIKN